MIANYQQPGAAIDYINTTGEAIKAGQVVALATRIGVAGTDIPVSGVGSLHVKGVYVMPKATGAIDVGAEVYFDSSAGKITTTAGGNVRAGWAIASAKNDDATVQVSIG